MRRAGLNVQSHSKSFKPSSWHLIVLKKPKPLFHILEDTINLVREYNAIDTMQRARALGYLVSIGIRVIETSNIEGRIEALEQILKNRNENENKHTNTMQTERPRAWQRH